MIYFVIAILLFFSFLISLRKTYTPAKYINFIFILVLSVFAFRNVNVGGDTLKYVYEFTHDQYRGREIGYVLFCDFIRFFGDTPFVYLFFTSLISILPFLLLIRKHSNNSILSLLYVFCFFNLIICFETHIRQNIGTGFVMLSIYIWEIVSSKSWKFWIIPLLFLVFGVLCHSSLYITVPLCLIIPFLPINKKIGIIVVIAAFFIGGVMQQLIVGIFQLLYSLIDGYDAFDRILAYSEDGSLGGYDMSPFNVSNIILFLWMMFIIFASENNNSYYFKAFVLYGVLHCLFRTSDLTFRSFFIINILALIYIPAKIQRRSIYKIIMCVFLVDWLQYLYRLCVTPSMQNKDAFMFPYTFIFE